MTSFHSLKKSLLIVFLLSLSLRLFVFFVMSGQVGASELPKLIEDSRNYFKAAEIIREQFDFDAYPGNIFGPGYPTFIAMIQSGWESPRAVVLIQILLSAISSCMLAGLAWRLTGSCIVSLVAGLLHACSVASIALANLIMSDSVFFFVLLLGMVLFVTGMQTGRWRLCVSSGIPFGIAPLIRSIGAFFWVPLAIITIALLWPTAQATWREKSRESLAPLIAFAIGLLILFAWVERPREPIDPPLAYSSYTGMYKVSAVTRARLEGIKYDSAIIEMEVELQRLLPEYNNRLYLAFMHYSRSEFLGLLGSHPVSIVGAIASASWEKVNSSRTQLWRCIPSHAPAINFVERWIETVGLNYRVTFLALMGLIVLIRQKQYRLVTILSSIYIYFAVLSGFTANTGNRVFLPGMIAWAILIAYSMVIAIGYIKAISGRAGGYNPQCKKLS